MKYKTDEYQRRLGLRNSAKEFMIILKSLNELPEEDSVKLSNYSNLLDFMIDLGFYNEFNVPDDLKKLFKFSDLFFTQVQNFKVAGKFTLSDDAQKSIIKGILTFISVADVFKPMLDNMERKRVMFEAFNYK